MELDDAGDEEYRRQTLRYGQIELGLDESVSIMALFTLWLRAAAVSFVVWFAFFVIWLFSGGANNGGLGGISNTGVLSAGAVAGFVAFWVVLLVQRVTEPLGEWKSVIEGKAGAGDSAYAAICEVLRERRIPASFSVRRIRTQVLPSRTVNNRLVVRDGAYEAYVSVFPYGTGLYVGWTMWRRRPGYVLIGQFVTTMFAMSTRVDAEVVSMLRTEKARAMREAVHAAAREGVDMAINETDVSLVGALGYEPAVEELLLSAPGTSPTPPVPPTPARPAAAPSAAARPAPAPSAAARPTASGGSSGAVPPPEPPGPAATPEG